MIARPLRCSGLLLALSLSATLPVAAFQALPEQQQKLIAAARAYSNRYSENLPSFICTQTVDQFEGDKKAHHWRKGDSLTSQLVWDRGREQRTLQLVNSRPVPAHKLWRSPLVSEGEFGNLLDSVFSSESQASFTFRGWENLDGKRLAVFAYNVDQQHSKLRLSMGMYDTVVACWGVIYLDEDNGTVWRITNDADNFPQELHTKSVSRSVDYSEVAIGDNRYVLPVHASVILNTGERNLRNELRFESYRKFTADSRISFGADDPPK
ncbi:MAG TPA: hypothetical protein VH302_16430 [Bryobacteraceae bacterium]|nr:hypothetical protein [Bryobacteraceae bacterium]